MESRLVNPLRGPAPCDLSAAPGTREESGEGKMGPGDGTGVGSRSLIVHRERERVHVHTRFCTNTHTCVH